MKHIAIIISNNLTVPYFNWLAEASKNSTDIKFTFIALCKEKPIMIEEVGAFGCDCFWVKFDWKKRKRSWISCTIKLYKVLKQIKPDIVHSNLFDDAIPTLITSYLLGIKRRIVTKADTGFHWSYAHKGILFDKLVNFLATDIIAISTESKEFILKKEKADPTKIVLIHHGIKIDEQINLINKEVVTQFNLRYGLEGKIVVGMVSRLVEWKGVHYAIEAARIICEKYPDLIFLVAGVGTAENKLRELIDKYQLTNKFILAGRIDPSEMPSFFETFDIFLHTASMEPFGFVIPEAMAHSLALVCTSTGSAKDSIRHKQNGYLIESKNPEQIIAGIEWVLKNNRNKELNKAALQTVHELFDFKFMYNNYVKLYLRENRFSVISNSPADNSKRHVVMIIANSSNPSYFRWFAELNHKEGAFKLSFIFLHTELPPIAEEVKKYNVSSYWLYFNTYEWKPFQYLKSFVRFYFLFKKLLPDVVHTNLFDDTLPALVAARLLKIKNRIITKQDTGFHVNNAASIVKYDIFNNTNATHLIACSEESKEFILNYEKGDKNKISLIHHGVDEHFITSASESQIAEVKQKFGLYGKKVIGTIARYIELKGYKDFINAAEMVVKKHPDTIFLCVGEGPQQQEMEDLIKQKGLQNHVVLTCWIDYRLIPAVYHCMDIYVHAAVLEPFGFVIAEAMFNKKPIVSTRVGASRDVLVHKESAFLINHNAPAEIAEGVDYFLTNPHPEIVEKAYSLAVTNFSRENMWNSYKKLFAS